MCAWNKWTILQDLVLAVVINTSAMLLSGASIEAVTWYPGTCTAFCTNVVLQLILPVPMMGQAATRAMAGKRYRFAFSVFVENLVFVTCISLTMAYVNTAGAGMVGAWLSTYIALVLIGYITSLMLYGVGRTAAVRRMVEG